MCTCTNASEKATLKEHLSVLQMDCIAQKYDHKSCRCSCAAMLYEAAEGVQVGHRSMLERNDDGTVAINYSLHNDNALEQSSCQLPSLKAKNSTALLCPPVTMYEGITM